MGFFTISFFFSYNFHYLVEGGVIYLCMASQDFTYRVSYNFLFDISNRFKNTYGSKIQTAGPLGMNDTFSRVLKERIVTICFLFFFYQNFLFLKRNFFLMIKEEMIKFLKWKEKLKIQRKLWFKILVFFNLSYYFFKFNFSFFFSNYLDKVLERGSK